MSKAGARRFSAGDFPNECAREAGQVIGTFDVPARHPAKVVARGMVAFEEAINAAVKLGKQEVVKEMKRVCAEAFERAEAILADAEPDDAA